MRTIKIKLDIEYPKREFLGIDGKPNPEAKASHSSIAVIVQGVNLRHDPNRGEGMDLSKLRMWSRIQDKLFDENGKAVEGVIELSEEQFEFIYNAVTMCERYQPGFATAVATFSDYLDKVRAGKGEEKE